MKKFFIPLTLAIAASSAAFAQSSALDAKAPSVYYPSTIDQTATNSIDTVKQIETKARFGDGSPVYTNNGATVDKAATGSLNSGTAFDETRARFGDGSPRLVN